MKNPNDRMSGPDVARDAPRDTAAGTDLLDEKALGSGGGESWNGHAANAANASVDTGGTSVMKVLVSGSSGLVGSALVDRLKDRGDEVTTLVRKSPGTGQVEWQPSQGTLDAGALEGLDAVVHLAGESIAEGRWNDAKKKRIRDSRVQGTRLLAETLAKLENKPKVLVCASAIGFYGNRGADVMREDSAAGSGYLADVCREWESAADAARAAGIRVVHLRIGVVLSQRGGALAKMLLPFKLGAGGNIGSGKQYMSWIELDDLVSIVLHAVETDSLSGPVNAVSPQAVTNAEYTKTLGRVLGRPTIFPMPGFAARLAFGEMADELLLSSTRVEPGALQTSGFDYAHGDLEGALRHALGRSGT